MANRKKINTPKQNNIIKLKLYIENGKRKDISTNGKGSNLRDYGQTSNS